MLARGTLELTMLSGRVDSISIVFSPFWVNCVWSGGLCLVDSQCIIYLIIIMNKRRMKSKFGKQWWDYPGTRLSTRVQQPWFWLLCTSLTHGIVITNIDSCWYHAMQHHLHHVFISSLEVCHEWGAPWFLVQSWAHRDGLAWTRGNCSCRDVCGPATVWSPSDL